jgi:hypothetical protein
MRKVHPGAWVQRGRRSKWGALCLQAAWALPASPWGAPPAARMQRGRPCSMARPTAALRRRLSRSSSRSLRLSRRPPCRIDRSSPAPSTKAGRRVAGGCSVLPLLLQVNRTYYACALFAQGCCMMLCGSQSIQHLTKRNGAVNTMLLLHGTRFWQSRCGCTLPRPSCKHLNRLPCARRSGRRGKMGRPPWKHLGLGSGRGRGSRAPAGPLSGAVAVLPAQQAPAMVGPVAPMIPASSAPPAGGALTRSAASVAAAPGLPPPQVNGAAGAEPARATPAPAAGGCIPMVSPPGASPSGLAGLLAPPPSLQQRIPAESLAPSLRQPPLGSAPPAAQASPAGRQQQTHAPAHEPSAPPATQPGQAPQHVPGLLRQGSTPKILSGKGHTRKLHTSA